MIGYLDDVIRPLVLIILKESGYVKTIKAEDGDKNHRFTPFGINDDKLLEKYKTIWTKI